MKNIMFHPDVSPVNVPLASVVSGLVLPGSKAIPYMRGRHVGSTTMTVRTHLLPLFTLALPLYILSS